jgi:HSP20 family molecular chaperone IbpA
MTIRNSHYWMWTEACQLLDRAERMQRQFFELAPRPAGRPRWEPPVDVFETAQALYVTVALPGVAPHQVELVVDSTGLIVIGERNLPASLRSASIRRMEIPAGRFERRIELPAGRFELVERELVDGCLSVTLRKLGGAWRLS